MDTDELSKEAYEGILIEAERFNHDLTLQFGLLSYSCDNEEEYLTMAKDLVQQIFIMDDEFLEDIFFGSVPDRGKLFAALNKILNNIDEISRIPENKRTTRY